MKNLWPTLMLIALIPWRAYSQEVLTWESALAEFRRANPELAAAQQNFNKSKFQYQGAKSGFYPEVSASTTYSKADQGGQTGQSTLTNGSGALAGGGGSSDAQYKVALNVQQNIFNGLRDMEKVNEADANLQAAKANRRLSEAQLIFQLRSAFNQALYLQDYLQLSQATISRRKGNLGLVQLLFESGRENKGSFLRSQAIYRQAVFDETQAKRNLEVAKGQLLTLLGRDQHGDLTLSGKLEGAPVPEKEPSFSELADRVPATEQVRYQAQAAEAAARGANGAHLPTVAVNGSVFRIGSEFVPKNDGWSVGATLSLPLFTGFATESNVRTARAEAFRSNYLFENQKRKSQNDLREAFANWKNAVEKVTVSVDSLKAAEVRSEIARTKYTNGLTSFEDWDLIENDLINQQKDNLASRRDAANAAATWLQVTAQGVEE